MGVNTPAHRALQWLLDLGLLQWLLDLDRIRLGRDAPLSLHWQSHWPMWLIGPCAVLIFVAILFIYRAEPGRRVRRIVLASLRIALIALVIAMVSGPVLRLQRERVERATVAMLVDNSQSMSFTDQSGPIADQSPRYDALKTAILKNDAAPIKALLTNNRLDLYTFSASLLHRATASMPADVPAISQQIAGIQCQTDGSRIVTAIKDTLQESRPERLAALIIASDGQSTESADIQEVIHAALAQKVPIHTILLGDPTPRRDLALENVTYRRTAIIKDHIAIGARITARGLTGDTPARITLQGAAGQTISHTEATLSPGSPHADIELSVNPDQPGQHTYTLRVEPLADEWNADNNTAQIRIRVVDDKIRVLYVDGYPRYQYRFLKNMLLREPTIRSSCLLLGADPDFAQEGVDPIRRFPQTLEELAPYDVILFGDVDPSANWLTSAQAELLVEHIAENGAGFGLIAGSRFAPHAFLGTPLQRIIPIRIDPQFLGTYPHDLDTSLTPSVTDEGSSSRIFRMFDMADTGSDPLIQLPPIYWIARTLGPKPGAEVLAEVVTRATEDTSLPVLVTARFGAGTLCFIGTDDLWRWRRGNNEWRHDAFWLQICRTLMRPRDAGIDRRVRLTTDRSLYDIARPVQIRADILDVDLLPDFGETLDIIVSDAEELPAARVSLHRLSQTARAYEGAFVPPRIGVYTAKIEGLSSAPGRRPATADFEVRRSELEMQNAHADHALLRKLAAETGGHAFRPEEMLYAFARIEDRSIRIPDDIEEPLWDSKIALILFISLITTEWIVRKAYGYA